MSRPTIPKPVAPRVRAESIPGQMKARVQWVVWKYVWTPPKKQRLGQWDKPLFNAAIGNLASSTDPDTWCSFDDAWAAYSDPAHGYDGIGYVFSGDDDDFVGVDLDDCRDPATGQILAWTPEQRACKHWAEDAPDPQRIIDALPTYAEVSPSGQGVKLFVKAKIAKAIKHGSVEMYSCARYFTVTGQKLESSPATITDCGDALAGIYDKFDALKKAKRTGSAGAPRSPESNSAPLPADAVVPTVEQVIAACENAANSNKFHRLFGGDTSGYPSQSEAELALCGMVAFYSAGQASIVDAVIRQSNLFRDKWDQRRGEQTYGQMTVAAALHHCSRFYDWSGCGKKGPKTFTICNVTLVLDDVRRTPAKLIVRLNVQKSGRTVDRISLSDAVSNRKQCVKSILRRIDSPSETTAAEADQVLGAILVQAAEFNQKRRAGRTIHRILAEHVGPAIGLQYRMKGGKAYSGQLGQEITLPQFIERFRNSDVIELASRACDAPKDPSGEVNRQQLIGRVEQELKVVWSDLLRVLPTISQAEIPLNSPPAVALRQAIILLFTKPASMGITEHPASKGKTVQLANRTTLASRVRRMQTGEVERCQGRWVEIQEGYKAYYREHIDEKGEVIPLLAMRVELAGQIGVTIPDVVDQASLRTLGEKFHAFDPSPPVAARLTGGGRLAVLTRSLTEQILAEPLEDVGATMDDSSDTPRGVPCHSASLAVTGRKPPTNAQGKENPNSDTKSAVTLSLGDAVTGTEPSPEEVLPSRTALRSH